MSVENAVEQQLQELRNQADEIVPEHELRRKLTDSLVEGRPLRVKYGIDPTNPHIHIGHLVPCRVLRTFQDFGHTAVLIVGDYTARIGDPTGRNEERPGLSGEDVQRNMERYIEQLSIVVDTGAAEIHYQSEWFDAASLADTMRLLASASVAQMLAHETFRRRVDAGTRLSLHELAYPLLQAQDSVEVRADVEIGGTDQRFNCLCGRDLQRDQGHNPQVVITVPLLPGTDGAKMSKSLGNHIATELSPEEIVGRIMSLADDAMPTYVRLATSWPPHMKSEFLSQLADGSLHPRDAKLSIAADIASQLHDNDAAHAAVEAFTRVFSERRVPEDVPVLSVASSPVRIDDLMLASGFVASRSAARRLVAQKAVKVDDTPIDDPAERIDIPADGVILRVGKRKFARVIVSRLP